MALRLRTKNISRDAVLFGGGLAGIFHETVINQAERPFLLALFGAMVGLTGFLRADEKRQESDASDDKEEAES